MAQFGPELKKWTDSVDRERLSPMMQQYVEQKEAWPDCLLFFRLGDFYELFFDDALVAAEELEITLTSRECGLEERAPMCGVPYHSVDSYLAKLMDRNYKVAICEQMEDPATTKGLVKRAVIRVVTPGTVTDLNKLDEKKNNYLVCVYQLSDYFGLAALDLTTGTFEATALAFGAITSKLMDELERFAPAEILANERFIESGLAAKVAARWTVTITESPDGDFSPEPWSAYFPPTDDHHALWKKAASGLLHYIQKTQQQLPDHIGVVSVYDPQQYMTLDVSARRNLELTETLRSHSKRGSLLWTIDRTSTSMGGRLLRRWIEQPLITVDDILARQEAVAEFKDAFISRQELREKLKGMGDLERLSTKLSLGSVNARDLVALDQALKRLPGILYVLSELRSPYLVQIRGQLSDFEQLQALLEAAIDPDPPIGLKDGGLIRDGFNEEVDRVRAADKNGQQWILDLEAREREQTGIKNLKVGYNRVFGYYFDVTKSNLSQIPDTYIRKQTLTNSERFYTQELKEMEDSILGARQRSIDLEYEVFCTIRDEVKSHAPRIRETAAALAHLDVIQGLAEQADRARYCRPVVDDSDVLVIEGGRHPVVEQMLGPGSFVPNDTLLNMGDDRLLLITGPNMAGKSTYMRQVAQIALLAQIGSFVPADQAHIGITDGVFTRIGASDDLSSGDSTFMVEMKEVADILHRATPRSLIILDEIGRGTSTYDGLAIAWAVMESISDPSRLGARTLFATHYHELTDLEGTVNGLRNYHVEVNERSEDIVFLHHIAQGPSDESYGVEVAKLAGVPSPVVSRAREILAMLEKQGQKRTRLRVKQTARPMDGQMDLFSSSLSLREYDEIIDELKSMDVQQMTPLDALNRLYEFSRKAKQIQKDSGK